jgi:3-deoxy-D-manno-octulosonic-acid transferase
MLLYNVLLTILSPLVLAIAWWHPGLREGLNERLGTWKDRARIDAIRGKAIWLHGVSAGEGRLLKPLIEELRRRLPDTPFFATTITPAGMRVLEQFADSETVVASYFPLVDLPWISNRFVNAVRPLIYITTEAEAWPNLTGILKRRGIKSMLVNARLFAASKSALELRGVRWLMRDFHMILCQTQQFADNFTRIGVPRDRLRAVGNIKSDLAIAPWDDAQLNEFKRKHGWEGSRVLIAGSTHPGEEEPILNAFAALRAKHPEWVLAITPRHPERRDEVMALCKQKGLDAALLSSGGAGAPVLVVDVMGVLIDYYRCADLVILGGTFNPKVGGHNVLEPAHLAKAVIAGPHVDSIEDSMERLRPADAVLCSGVERLGQDTLTLAEDDARRTGMGRRAQEVAISLAGATKLTVDAVMDALDSSRAYHCS